AAVGRSHEQLLWHRPVAGMKLERLLGTQIPCCAEALAEVVGAEAPERCVPDRAFASGFSGQGGDVPAFHDFLEEATTAQALAMQPGQVMGADRNAAPILKGLQEGQ